MSARCFQITSVILIIGASAIFVGAFAGTGWLSGHKYDYGLWRMCETNTTTTQICHRLSPGTQKGYFEASRTLACFALVFCIINIAACFVEENEEDAGMKLTCYRYFFCFSTLLTVALEIGTLAALGGQYKKDPQFSGMHLEPGWCVTLTGVSIGLTFLSCICRFKFITSQHDTDDPGACCCVECEDHRTKPDPTHLDLDISEVSASASAVGNGGHRVPSLVLRRTSSGTSDGLGDRIAHLPPLPGKSRGGGGGAGGAGGAGGGGGGGALQRSSSVRSSDSGLDSKDVSRDSILDETQGPLPLSVEMLKRHDRRLTGASGRRYDDRRRRPAFSSTTSLSTTDSQSSAELAPRVHTPTNTKRVHYNDVPKGLRHPETASVTDGPPPPLSFRRGSRGEIQDPPIISLPIKVQGVELSRAKTNAATSATLDTLRTTSSTLKKWKGPATETIVEEEKVAESGESRASSRQKKTRSSKKSKRKKTKATAEQE